MKKIAVLLFALAFGYSVSAQQMKEADVPALVKSSFQKLYPGIQVKKWEKEKDNYEAEFTKDKEEMSAVFNAHGNQLETEVSIPVSDLPAGVTTYLDSHYQKVKIKEAAKILTADGNLSYEVDIGKADLIFDSNGQFLKEEKDQDDDKD